MTANGVAEMPSRRRILLRLIEGDDIEHWIAPLRVRRLDVERSDRAEHYALLKQLFALSSMGLSERRRTLVFIPKSNEAFFGIEVMKPSLGAIGGGCMIAPFLVPSISGMAMLQGYPRSGCPLLYYGYEHYRQKSDTLVYHHQASDLCRAAREKGFFRLVVLDTVGIHWSTPVLLQCDIQL